MTNRSLRPTYSAFRLLLRLALLLALAGCGPKTVTVQIPPRVDLQHWPLIGLIDFSTPDHPELTEAVTRQFQTDLQAAQPGARLLELGRLPDLLRETRSAQLDPEAIKAIGKKYGVAAVLSGTLEVTPATPGLNISPDLRSLHAKVSVKGELFAKIRETATGATAWSNGAHGTWTLAQMSLGLNGFSSLGATPAAERYDQMLRDLSGVATRDFWPRYERRRIQP